MAFQTVITGYLALLSALSSNDQPTELASGNGYARIQTPVLYDAAIGEIEFPAGVSFLASGTWSAATYAALFDASSGGNCLLAWQLPSVTGASATPITYPAHTFDIQLTKPLPVGVPVPAGTVLGAVINASGNALASNVVNPVALTYSGATLAATQIPVATLIENSGTVIVDGSLGKHFLVTLTANATFNAPINIGVGDVRDLEIVQDATGTRTATWATGWRFSGGSRTLSTSANAVDKVRFVNMDGTHWDGDLSKAFA